MLAVASLPSTGTNLGVLTFGLARDSGLLTMLLACWGALLLLGAVGEAVSEEALMAVDDLMSWILDSEARR
jgi:hypothetical protein